MLAKAIAATGAALFLSLAPSAAFADMPESRPVYKDAERFDEGARDQGSSYRQHRGYQDYRSYSQPRYYPRQRAAYHRHHQHYSASDGGYAPRRAHRPWQSHAYQGQGHYRAAPSYDYGYGHGTVGYGGSAGYDYGHGHGAVGYGASAGYGYGTSYGVSAGYRHGHSAGYSYGVSAYPVASYGYSVKSHPGYGSGHNAGYSYGYGGSAGSYAPIYNQPRCVCN
jgi:hypothetical protein